MVTLPPARLALERLHASILRRQRTRLETHPLFSALASVAHVRAFMEIHVFAVWDFMSLAKRLQRELTHTELPWLPPRDSEAARLINEIVLAEESDVGFDGRATSHFDLYLGGMREVGADTTVITRFLKALRAGTTTDEALADPDIPGFVSDFVGKTLATALHGSRLQVMAGFLYGRENVIPGMFRSLLNNWGLRNEDAPRFAYYLQRHIEVDTDTHGPAAARLIARELEANPEGLEIVRRTAEEAIDARRTLWDGTLDHLRRFVR